MAIASDWRLKQQRYRLVGEECKKCGVRIFPPRDVCPGCEAPAQAPFEFSGRGEVYSFSTVYQAQAEFAEYVPYTVGLVKLEEGPLVSAQLADVDGEEVQIGMPVEMVTRKIREEGDEGLIVYGYKFRKPLQKQTA